MVSSNRQDHTSTDTYIDTISRAFCVFGKTALMISAGVCVLLRYWMEQGLQTQFLTWKINRCRPREGRPTSVTQRGDEMPGTWPACGILVCKTILRVGTSRGKASLRQDIQTCLRTCRRLWLLLCCRPCGPLEDNSRDSRDFLAG